MFLFCTFDFLFLFYKTIRIIWTKLRCMNAVTIWDLWRVLSVWLLARILNFAVQASRSNFTPTTEKGPCVRNERSASLGKYAASWKLYEAGGEITGRFDGPRTHCNIHRCTDQNTSGIIFRVWQERIHWTEIKCLNYNQINFEFLLLHDKGNQIINSRHSAPLFPLQL